MNIFYKFNKLKKLMKDELSISTCRNLKSYSNDFKYEKNVNLMMDFKIDIFEDKKSNHATVDSFKDKMICPPKLINELFESKDRNFRNEFSIIKPSIEKPILYKGSNHYNYKKYHLSFNNIYLVDYQEKTK